MIDLELTILEEDEYQQEFYGTPFYMAPEVFEHKYNHKCDLWATGVLMYLLLIGDYPYNPENYEDIHEEIYNKSHQIYDHSRFQNISEEAISLLKSLLEFDIEKRISAE